jgi:radical SAM protein with 4Fe4S-binding SPASM domain
MEEGEKKGNQIPDVIGSLKRALENPIARYILRSLSKGDSLEKALAIFAGTETRTCIRCQFHAFLLGTTIKSGAKKLEVGEERILNYFNDRSVQRGIANIIRGIAEYGITKPQKLHAPFLVVWDYTKACNLRCTHCYAEAGKLAPDELTTAERKEVVDQLYDAGVAALSFSGGEPLMQKDFFEVASYAASKYLYVTIATNGTLITKEVARKLRECGVKYAEVSLDGPREIHDAIRGVEGAFERTLEGLRNCIAEGIKTGMAMTVMKSNRAYVPEMVELARDLGVDRFIAFNFIPVGGGREQWNMDLSSEEREEVLEYLYDQMMKRSGLEIFCTAPEYARVALEEAYEGEGEVVPVSHFAAFDLKSKTVALTDFIGGCGAGRLYCSIEHNGDIQPCVFMPIKVGNVLKDGFANVWHNSEVLEQLRDREQLKGVCGSCEYKYVCGGCRARAYAYFGDYLASEPGAKEHRR